jgi:hypothetical protein
LIAAAFDASVGEVVAASPCLSRGDREIDPATSARPLVVEAVGVADMRRPSSACSATTIARRLMMPTTFYVVSNDEVSAHVTSPQRQIRKIRFAKEVDSFP